MDNRPSTPAFRKAESQLAITSEDEEDATDRVHQKPSSESINKRSASAISKEHTTPSKRRKTPSSILTVQRRNVDEAVKELEPNTDRPFCVVTRASPNMTILEYAHVLGAATPYKVLDLLEWAWNIDYFKLNVDTRRNIHPLDIAIHRYFDRTEDEKHNGWFWLPTDLDTIGKMYAYYVDVNVMQPKPVEYPDVRRNPDEFYQNKKSFKYRFTPFPAMKAAWTVRQPTIPASQFTEQAKVARHYYPFDTVSAISLHIPYHFVICDTGRKLQGAYGGDYKDTTKIERDFPHLGLFDIIMLSAVRGIYDAWMHAKPSNAWKSSTAPYDQGHPSRAGGPDDSSSHVGSGGTSRDDENQGSGGQGLPDRNDNTAPTGPGCGMGGTPVGHCTSARSSLAPEDSTSCCDVAEESEGSGEEAPADEDEEWEDPEWYAWLETWVEDVWEATHGGAPSPSSSEETLIGTPAAGKVTSSMGLPESQLTTTSM